MYDEPEYNEYDDDEYKFYPNEYNEHEHGYPKAFKFDWASWEKWLSQAIKEIYEEKFKYLDSNQQIEKRTSPESFL